MELMRWARRLGGSALLASLAAAAGTLWAAARPRPPGSGVAHEPPEDLPPARIVNVPGRGEMFVREAPGPGPDAPTVVLVHGWMFPADLHWFGCYGALSEIARVIAMDHRGHGRGLRPPAPFRLIDVADDIAALLDHMQAPPAVVVGYSMGGTVAQLLWQRHPDVVHGLVLCATSAVFNLRLRDRAVWRGMGLLQIVMRLLPRHWFQALLELQASGRLPFRVTRMIAADPPPHIRSLLGWMVGEFDRDSAEDVAEAGRELSRYDARGWLGSVDVPAAVLITSLDRLVPAANQRDLAARIPGAAVYELSADHDAIVSPGDFLPTLCKAVQEIAAR